MLVRHCQNVPIRLSQQQHRRLCRPTRHVHLPRPHPLTAQPYRIQRANRQQPSQRAKENNSLPRHQLTNPRPNPKNKDCRTIKGTAAREMTKRTTSSGRRNSQLMIVAGPLTSKSVVTQLGRRHRPLVKTLVPKLRSTSLSEGLSANGHLMFGAGRSHSVYVLRLFAPKT